MAAAKASIRNNTSITQAMLEAFQKTVDAFVHAVDLFAEAAHKPDPRIDVLDTAVLGGWNDKQNKKIPGLADRADQNDARWETRDKRDRYIIIIGGMMITTMWLEALGIPLKSLWPAIWWGLQHIQGA